MKSKWIGGIFLFVALELIAMVVAGSHGHYQFNPRMLQDWILWISVLSLSLMGGWLLFKRKRV